jgi:DNA-directed RNA polymerase subunit RPC12/RpoP
VAKPGATALVEHRPRARLRRAVNDPTSRCGACGAQIDQREDAPADETIVCLACGLRTRRFKQLIKTEVPTQANVRSKARRQGTRGRPFLEMVFGASFDRARQKWLQIEQIVYRETRRYRKRIVDPSTGEVIRDDDGPLDEHKGFGSPQRHEP